MKKLIVVALILDLMLFFTSPALPAAAPTATLTLGWTDTSDNEDGFRVYRSTTGPAGTFTLLATVLSDAAGKLNVGRTVTYVDTGLAFSTQYCYQISSFNAAGESARTAPGCATTTAAPIVVPTPPVNLTVTVNQ